MSILPNMNFSWDMFCSYVKDMSVTTKVIIGGTSVLLVARWIRNRQINARLPPGPFPLPLLGNLLSLRNKSMETVISEWQQKYGPIFTIYFGLTRLVVVTDIDLINDALVKQGSNVSGRPYVMSFDVQTEGSKDIAAAPYGDFWKFQRKITVQALRQYLSGDQFEERVHEVTQAVIQNMEMEAGPVDFHMHMSLSVFNILHGLCFGETFGFDNPTFRKMIKVADDLGVKSAEGFLEDALPLLRLWPTKNFREAVECVNWFNGYIHKQMDQHRANFDEGAMTCLADNIIQAEKLSQAEGEATGHKLSDTHAAQILADVFGAGVDTMRSTISWVFLVLINHSDIQQRMQEEIDAVVGDQTPGREHRSKLVYTQAVVFEAMRLYPAAPYGLPHETMRDTNIGGYSIPKKTTVLVSFLSVLRDPQHWEDPLTFKPERFLDETQTKIEMREKSFIPFSIGHRTCPGEGLAKLQILYIIVALLQKFTFSLPPGEEVELVTLIKGFLNTPPPFKVMIRQR